MCAARVDGHRVLLDVPDGAFLVHDERGAIGEPVLLVQDSVLLRDGPLKVAEEGEIKALLFRKSLVGG